MSKKVLHMFLQECKILILLTRELRTQELSRMFLVQIRGQCMLYKFFIRLRLDSVHRLERNRLVGACDPYMTRQTSDDSLTQAEPSWVKIPSPNSGSMMSRRSP